MLTPGVVAFFVILAMLTASYALLAPNRPVEHSDPIHPDGYVPGTFDKYVRPIIKNVMPTSPGVLGAYARGSEGTADVLRRSGNPWQINSEEYILLRVIAAAAGGAIFSMLAMTGQFMFTPQVAFAIGLGLGFMVPSTLLSSAWSKRRKEINRTLPEALDLLRICLNAGYNFTNALGQVVELLPEGTTRDELGRVVADLRAGRTVAQSMEDFSERMPTEQVESFVKAVNVSQSMGTDMAQTLSQQANEARLQYERMVEVKAQKLQTTLFLPIIGMFLPCLCILIFGPSLSELGNVL